MKEKLKGVSGMLIDVNNNNVFDTEECKSIYREINNNSSKRQHRVGKKDVPMLVYSALLYDKNSPFRKLPIDDRKKLAVEHAQFETKREVEDAIHLRTPRGLAIAHLYLRYQADESWGLYCSISENYWRNNEKILKGSDDLKEQETINKLLIQNTSYVETLSKLKDTIFGDNREHLQDIVNFTVEDFVDSLLGVSEKDEDDAEIELDD